MSFFDTLNERFFNPFCCRNRSLYFACISQLIEKSKEIPVLYETDARGYTDFVSSELPVYDRNRKYRGGDHKRAFPPGETPPQSSVIFVPAAGSRPRRSGRSGDNLASVTAYCRKLVDAIQRIFGGDANGAITNHIFSMYEILKSSFGKDSARAIRPYQNILVPLIENECDLKNELLILKDNIREIMRAVMKMADVNSFGQFLIKDELLKPLSSTIIFLY